MRREAGKDSEFSQLLGKSGCKEEQRNGSVGDGKSKDK